MNEGWFSNPRSHTLIKCNWEIGLETPTVNWIHIVSCTFIYASIHLRCWINFNFRFDFIIAYSPLIHLQANNKPQRKPFNEKEPHFQILFFLLYFSKKFTYVKGKIRILTCIYGCWNSSAPSLSHVISGRGFPAATHKNAILWPSVYS